MRNTLGDAVASGSEQIAQARVFGTCFRTHKTEPQRVESQAGARRVLPEFGFAKIEPRQIARETVVNVTFLGIEDA